MQVILEKESVLPPSFSNTDWVRISGQWRAGCSCSDRSPERRLCETTYKHKSELKLLLQKELLHFLFVMTQLCLCVCVFVCLCVLPMKAPTLPIRLNRQLSGGKEPHLLQNMERKTALSILSSYITACPATVCLPHIKIYIMSRQKVQKQTKWLLSHMCGLWENVKHALWCHIEM